MGNKCAEISLTCKHRDHTFISPRPAGTFNKQNTLLLHCYSALAAATSWKISDEEDKNISYKLYPGSRGAGRRELDCRVVLTSPRTAPSTTAAAHGKISRSRIEINWSKVWSQIEVWEQSSVFIVPGVTEKMCNYFGSLKHENVPLGYGKMRPSLLFWTIKILKTVLILSIRLLSISAIKRKVWTKKLYDTCFTVRDKHWRRI